MTLLFTGIPFTFLIIRKCGFNVTFLCKFLDMTYWTELDCYKNNFEFQVKNYNENRRKKNEIEFLFIFIHRFVHIMIL